MAIAATLVLAVGVGWRFGPWGTTSEPVYRSVEEQAITSGLADGAVLTRTAPVLRWTPIEGARYRVRVLTPDLDVLVEADELTEAEYTLGPEVLGRLAPGSQVLWQVEARAAGRGALESPTFTVRVE